MGNIFNWATTQLLHRIKTMRSAEASLITFANRYGASGGTEKGGDNQLDEIIMSKSKRNQNSSSPSTIFELFDTEIPRSVVPLKNSDNDQTCQLLTSNCEKTKQDSKKSFIMHGIKVTTQRYCNNTDESNNEEKGVSSSSSSPLVLLHGYCNGALYYYRNLMGLSNHQRFNGTVYALDLLGWGLSSRPAFQLKASMTNDDGDCSDTVDTAEQFFVESLEAWRKENKLDKITLSGHSMGGYISVAYCEKYPQHVDRLILISPVGVLHEMKADDDLNKQTRKLPLCAKFFIGLASAFWKLGITPSSFLRSLPESRGKQMVSSYVTNRLPTVTCTNERAALTEYLHANAALPGSGEYCLNKILKPLAYARKPLVDRIPCLNVRHVAFIYGQRDWMDPSGGLEVQQKCKKLHTNRKKEEGTNNNDDTTKENDYLPPEITMFAVKDAGHLLMLENWEEFNSAMILAGAGKGGKRNCFGDRGNKKQNSEELKIIIWEEDFPLVDRNILLVFVTLLLFSHFCIYRLFS